MIAITTKEPQPGSQFNLSERSFSIPRGREHAVFHDLAKFRGDGNND